MMIYIKDIVKKVWRQIDFFNGYAKKKIVKHSLIYDS